MVRGKDAIVPIYLKHCQLRGVRIDFEGKKQHENAGQHLNISAFMDKYLYMEFKKNLIFVVLRFFCHFWI